MGYHHSHVVVARPAFGSASDVEPRISGPFTSLKKAQEFAGKLAKRPGMDKVTISVETLLKPRVLELARIMRGEN
jgi:hypothetical protein